jgi:hypothetical protein
VPAQSSSLRELRIPAPIAHLFRRCVNDWFRRLASKNDIEVSISLPFGQKR